MPAKGTGRPAVERFWPRVQRSDGCWLWTGPCNWLGYGQFAFNRDGRWTTAAAHRVAWRLVNGDIPPGVFVLHHCDNPPCVRPDHLFLGTQSANMRDMAGKGRGNSGERHASLTHPESFPRGSRHGNAKLNEQVVADLRRRVAAGQASQMDIARELGISSIQVWNIVHRRAWRHVLP